MTAPKVASAAAGVCECGARLATRRTWKQLTDLERTRLRFAAWLPHYARGLCGSCYARRRAAGTLPPASRPWGVSRDEVLDAWEQDPRAADESTAARVRRLAPRLGMTEVALERALYRAFKAVSA